MRRSESISKLAVSLVKFNSEVSKISKDAKNPFFKSNYVTLDKLIEATRPILQDNGLVVMQSPLSKENGSIGIQTLLIHESGEFIESEPIFMTPSKINDPQQAGSIISYMRRYSYQAILNLNTGEDDDCNKATSNEDKQAKLNKNYSTNNFTNNNLVNNVKPITEAQRKRLNAIASGIDKAVIKDIIAGYGFSNSQEITMDKYNTICDEIQGLKYEI